MIDTEEASHLWAPGASQRGPAWGLTPNCVGSKLDMTNAHSKRTQNQETDNHHEGRSAESIEAHTTNGMTCRNAT